MFHQIFVKQSEQDALRFVWKTDNSEKLKHFVMCVQLFGKNDSPCIGNYTLKRTINNNKEAYSDETIKDIENSFYMDEFTTNKRENVHNSKRSL